MNKAGNLGMHLHQTLSFCSLLARCDRNPAVFWPGCALMSLDPEILGRTLQILRRAEPEIGISTCCCGQPTRYLFPAKSASRQEWIRGILQHQGVERVYTACPNCGSELREWSGVDVVSIWPVLAQYLQPEDVLGPGGYCVLHDPCPLRNSSAELDAVRFLCSVAGVSITEPAHSGVHTLCCGNRHMLHSREPEKSEKLRQLRVSEFPAGLPVVSCCEGCLGAFRGEGRDTFHLLELIFGRSKKRSWMNRFNLSWMKRALIC